MSSPTDIREMLFADTAVLGALGLILLTVAIVAFIVWLAMGTREPDFVDVLRWVGAGVIGVILIAYTGSWHEVAIDPATKQVTERHGYLGHELEWMGQQRGFQDFTTVLVERTTSEQNNSTSYSSQSSYSRKSTRTVHSYTLILRGADRQITLPMASKDDMFFHFRAKPQGSGVTWPPMETSDDVLVLEAAARQLARLGNWEARRRGYALLVRRDEAADRPQDMRNEPAWFYRLPFMPTKEAATELQHSPVSIKIIALDAESPIDAE